MVAKLESALLSFLLADGEHRPPGLEPVNLRALSPLHRALLAIDGTVTKFLEAYTMEPMVIHRLAQERAPLARAHRWLGADGGTEILARQVLIESEYSRQVFVFAASALVPERLSEEAQRRLEAEGEGIGRILNETATESRREVLWYGRDRGDRLPAEVRGRVRGDVVWRAYRIIAGGRPVALVHEFFPYNTDTALARE